MSTLVPPLLECLVDDASVFPPGNAAMPDALAAHRQHRSAWYAPFVGPLLVPASSLGELAASLAAPLTAAPAVPTRRAASDSAARGGPGDSVARGGPDWSIGLIGDTGIDGLAAALERARAARIAVRQVEVAVAKRGEDPRPGLAKVLPLARQLDTFAEIPLTWGLLAALDTVAEARATGLRIAPKFRTGGLAAELFPTPVELAAVICACRDRQLPFKLTAGLHHALRHTDPETGFVHHGFLNVLVGAVAAADGAEVAEVAEALAYTHPLPLVETSRARRGDERPLWLGFGSCSIQEPLADLMRLGLIISGVE